MQAVPYYHTPRQTLTSFLRSPASATLDNEERAAVKIYLEIQPDMRMPCCVPKAKRAYCIRRSSPDQASLTAAPAWLKQMGCTVFPVRTHSSQKCLHSNKSHLAKLRRLSRVHALSGFQALQIPMADELLLSACQGVTTTQSERL